VNTVHSLIGQLIAGLPGFPCGNHFQTILLAAE